MDFELPGEDHPRRKPIRAWFEAHPSRRRDLARRGSSCRIGPAVGPRGGRRAAADHRPGDEARRRACPAQPGRHQQLRPVAADPWHRGPAPALPVPALAGRGDLVHAVQRAVGRLRSRRAAHRGATGRRPLCREGPQDLDLARPQGEGRHPGRAHQFRRAQAPGPVAVPGRYGHARHHACGRSSTCRATRTNTTRSSSRRCACRPTACSARRARAGSSA